MWIEVSVPMAKAGIKTILAGLERPFFGVDQDGGKRIRHLYKADKADTALALQFLGMLAARVEETEGNVADFKDAA